MNPTYGVCLYTIELDGCLNGLFTNEGARGKVFNEICRKRPVDPPRETPMGTYDSVYLDEEGNSNFLELTISAFENIPNVLQFEWRNRDNGNLLFEGKGYLISPRQVVVRYEGAA